MLKSSSFRITTYCGIVLACFLALTACKPEPSVKAGRQSPASSAPQAPSPSDGKGTAVANGPAEIPCSTPGTWTITYTAADTGIAVGGGIVFQISPFWGWTPPQNQSPSSPGFVTATCSNPKTNIKLSTSPPNRYAHVMVEQAPLFPGDTVTFTYGDTGNNENPGAAALSDRYAEKGERFFVKVDGDGDGFYTLLTQQPEVTVLPGPPAGLVVTAPSLVSPGQPFPVTIAAVDRMDNWVEQYTGSCTIASDPEGAVFTPRQSDEPVIQYTCTLPREGVFRFHAEDETKKLQGMSNTVTCDATPSPYSLYWADLHGHSRLSDGTGTVDDYYRYARYVAGLNAAALTDHDAWGFEMLDEHEHIWKQIKAVTNRHNIPGTFITFMGYEWTNWTSGHKHVLFRDEPAPLFSYRNPASDTPDKLWQQLKPYTAMTIAHHVGGGPIAADWTYYNPEMEPVVEVCSIHGNSEYLGSDRCIYNPQKGSFVQDALARGYHLGIIAGGDTHNGHPGRGDRQAAVNGIMAIYAPELTRASLWESIKKRRVYGTTGARMIINFTINGHMLGEVLQASKNPARNIFIQVTGDGALEKVLLIKNNVPFKSWDTGALTFTQTIQDTGTPAQKDFYYLRVIQADNHIGWSSPVWFE